MPWASAVLVWAVSTCAGDGASDPGPSDPSGLLPGGEAVGTVALRPGLDEAGRLRAGALAAYWAGLQRERSHDVGGAKGRYAEALRLDPGHWRLAGRLAEWEAEGGRWEEALGLLEGAVRAAPARPEPLLVLSDFCFRHRDDRDGMGAKAVAVAGEAVERFPGVADAPAWLIQLHLRMEAREVAVGVLERALARPEKDPRYWLGLTGAAMAVWPASEEGSLEKVTALFRKAHALAPDDPAVTGALADFLAQNRGLSEASSLYGAMVARRPDDLAAREKLARTLGLIGREAEAVEAWQGVLGIDPQHESAHRALARHFQRAGDLVSSVRHRAEALRWGRGETVGVALRLAREMLQAGMPRDAVPVLERAEFNAPASPEPPYLAALAHKAAGDLTRSLAAFAHAEEVARRDEQTAATFLTEGFFFEWALAASAGGQVGLAEAKFREAIARVPADHPELAAKAYNGLAYLWLETNQRIEEAGPLIARALKLDPGNPAYLDTLGWHHFRKGAFQQAADVLQQAEAAAPKPVAEIMDHRAQALRALGRRAEALELLEKAAASPEATPDIKRRLDDWRAGAP